MITHTAQKRAEHTAPLFCSLVGLIWAGTGRIRRHSTWSRPGFWGTDRPLFPKASIPAARNVAKSASIYNSSRGRGTRHTRPHREAAPRSAITKRRRLAAASGIKAHTPWRPQGASTKAPPGQRLKNPDKPPQQQREPPASSPGPRTRAAKSGIGASSSQRADGTGRNPRPFSSLPWAAGSIKRAQALFRGISSS